MALAALCPGAAQAECLSGGCYDGLGWLLGGVAAIGLGLIVTLIVLLVKRKFTAALILVGVCLVGAVLLF
ncbi:MAG: hypothetical protein ACRCS3_00220 [Paracoccaceae bacterium]